ncbi:hypothetical protein F4694_004699 [Bacillus niacini]|uniref:Uncharacterized protein n=1 Tax=Neobacillus niacini TaxID=86668 RepID=A0A852TKY1_9BACI|nr:hypothetical protein [Neobacillus niacini]NYE07858.1 hypothetical protein [Neobacillus niacini]
MLTRKISDLKGQSQIQVQVMDTGTPQIASLNTREKLVLRYLIDLLKIQ